jgi:hypothetical protein
LGLVGGRGTTEFTKYTKETVEKGKMRVSKAGQDFIERRGESSGEGWNFSCVFSLNRRIGPVV